MNTTTFKSAGKLGSVLKKPKISRKRLSRYSWLPDVLRLEGSITMRIIGPVLTVTLFATAIAYAHHEGHPVMLSNSVTPLLAVVVGLILVFRNGTSYDRYYEGRKDFGQMTSNIRNLARMIWVNVGPASSDASATTLKGKPSKRQRAVAQLRQKKIEALKLCVSFAYAVKHHLRDEPGIDYDDFKGVLPDSFARFDEIGFDTTSSTPGSPTEYQSITDADIRRKKLNHGISFNDSTVNVSQAGPHTPLLGDVHRTIEFHPYSAPVSMPLPLVIAHELSRLIYGYRRDGFLDTIGPAGANAMNQLIHGMVDQLTNMERIANTPIPISYGIHLKQCVTLYLFSLPFTLVRDLAWSMIPVVTVVAFTLMGIEGIANEIEMPFGRDKTDLPLDKYCAQAKDEVEYIIGRLPEGGYGMDGFDDGEGDD